ncbi:MAG TPA: hypothetical protein VK502_01275 [Candidatus Saccharimonadales bacterium]|nr:hypothetical protein [Candidatus Saccharimonadales bacterium]
MLHEEVRDDVLARLRTVVPGRLLADFDQIVIPPLDQLPMQPIELGVHKGRRWSFWAGYLGGRLAITPQKGVLSLKDAIALDRELFTKGLASKHNLHPYPYTDNEMVSEIVIRNMRYRGEARHWSYGLEELEAKLRGLN